MAQQIVFAATAYLWLGVAVAVPFLVWGIDRVEPNARGSYVFRAMLVPGIALLWPLVLWRWQALAREPARADSVARHKPPLRAQAWMGAALAITLPAILLSALVVRQDGPLERPAVLLEAAR